MRAAAAGLVYFAAVFALGFALGAVRALVVAPAVGETAAVAAELPAILAASWFAARVLVRRYGLARCRDRLTMGATAFALLMAAEALLSAVLAGRSFGEHLALYREAPHLLGLAGQIVFALLPALSKDDRISWS